jgi:hypothetical protein
MLIFGGFNGEYFNDLHYINIHTNRKKILSTPPLSLENVSGLKQIHSLKHNQVSTTDGKVVRVYYELLS